MQAYQKETCPCGSGMAFSNCCGRRARPEAQKRTDSPVLGYTVTFVITEHTALAYNQFTAASSKLPRIVSSVPLLAGDTWPATLSFLGNLLIAPTESEARRLIPKISEAFPGVDLTTAGIPEGEIVVHLAQYPLLVTPETFDRILTVLEDMGTGCHRYLQIQPGEVIPGFPAYRVIQLEEAIRQQAWAVIKRGMELRFQQEGSIGRRLAGN